MFVAILTHIRCQPGLFPVLLNYAFSHDGIVPMGPTAEQSVPSVGVVMGSRSDWDTMAAAHEILDQFDVAHECEIVSAHRTPERMRDYARGAADRGLEAIIAGAGGAAHLPGMLAAQTLVPVLGVPVQSRALDGTDSLLSIVQMPGGVPTATFAIGSSGARNAALFALAFMANTRPSLRGALAAYRQQLADDALAQPLPSA